MRKNNFHLTEDQIIMALVDKTGLPQAVRDHLSACPLCDLEKERLESRVDRFGYLSRRYAPPCNRRIIMEEVDRRSVGWNWEWWGGLSAGAIVAALVLVFIFSGSVGLWQDNSRSKLAGLVDEMLEDEQFVRDVDQFSGNALPQFCLDIYGGTDLIVSEEEFMEFVFPTTGELVSNKENGLC